MAGHGSPRPDDQAFHPNRKVHQEQFTSGQHDGGSGYYSHGGFGESPPQHGGVREPRRPKPNAPAGSAYR